MAKVTWLTVDAAYKEYYGKELPEVPKTKSNKLYEFKKGLVSNKIPLVITTLHDGTIQVSKESIEQVKMKYASSKAG